MSERQRIVVCGAGVIGAAIAQALAIRGMAVTILDRAGVAPAASGKAGGFLALDWNDGSPLGPLARRSFELHRELAGSLDADYGYRPVETLMVPAPPAPSSDGAARGGTSGWLDGVGEPPQTIGTHDTTAQVHPRQFTEALVADAQAHGAVLRVGQITAIRPGEDDGSGRGVVVGDDEIEADVVVVALGPWTARVGLPLPAIHAQKGASIVIAADAPAQAVFSEYATVDGRRFAPEIYPRLGNEVYVCGVPSADVLPASPEEVAASDDECDLLQEMAAAHSSLLAGSEVTERQACFRSLISDGLPLIGPVPAAPGVLVATGHGPWGILNAPATGEMIAEMVQGETPTVDPAPFDPARAA